MIQYIIIGIILVLAVAFSVKRIYDVFAKDDYCNCCGESKCGKKKRN